MGSSLADHIFAVFIHMTDEVEPQSEHPNELQTEEKKIKKEPQKLLRDPFM